MLYLSTRERPRVTAVARFYRLAPAIQQAIALRLRHSIAKAAP